MSNCSSCGARVEWAKTDKGRRIPLDPAPNAAGNLIIVGNERKLRVMHALRKDEDPPPIVPRYTTHFTTCPNAGEHRKPERSSAPSQESEQLFNPEGDAT